MGYFTAEMMNVEKNAIVNADKIAEIAKNKSKSKVPHLNQGGVFFLRKQR